MSRNIQLLKQIRNAVSAINQSTTNAEYKALLNPADCILNQLLLLERPQFYLDYLARGKNLLLEGRSLAERFGSKVPETQALRGDLTIEFRNEIIHAEIERLHDCLKYVVLLLDESRSFEEKTYLEKITDWECTLYQHNLEQIDNPSNTQINTITSEALQAYLIMKFPNWKNLQVTAFTALDGGFSKKTILFETEDDANGSQSMVIRAEQPLDLLGYEGSDVTQEYNSIILMLQSGLPIAQPLWLEDDRSHLGTRFIVSRRAVGKTYGGNLGNTEALPDELPTSMISTFIQMHNIKLNPSDPLMGKSHFREWMQFTTVREATLYSVTAFVRRLMRVTDVTASPQLERGLLWLEKNVPDVDEPPVIVHQDFSFNNLIIDGSKIAAVLDWESSIVGDPALDIVWTQFTLREQVPMPAFLKIYKEGTGRDISEYRLAYAQVAKLAFIVVSCLGAMRALDKHDNAHLNISIMAYKYLGLFGIEFNQLIAAAEAAKGH